LASAIAVILIRESAALFSAAAAVAAPVATAVTSAVTASFAAPVPIKSPTASAPRTAGCGLGTRFVHLQIAPANFFSIEAGNRLGGLGIVGHLDERKSTGTARLPVHCDMNARDLSKRLEQRTQIRLGRLKAHVAYKQVLHVLLSFDL
jgi:hypothetical protein